MFRPGHRAGVFIWENFHLGCRDLGHENRDLENRASPASHMNTSIVLQRKEWRGEISETEPARLTEPPLHTSLDCICTYKLTLFEQIIESNAEIKLEVSLNLFPHTLQIQQLLYYLFKLFSNSKRRKWALCFSAHQKQYNLVPRPRFLNQQFNNLQWAALLTSSVRWTWQNSFVFWMNNIKCYNISCFVHNIKCYNISCFVRWSSVFARLYLFQFLYFDRFEISWTWQNSFLFWMNNIKCYNISCFIHNIKCYNISCFVRWSSVFARLYLFQFLYFDWTRFKEEPLHLC